MSEGLVKIGKITLFPIDEISKVKKKDSQKRVCEVTDPELFLNSQNAQERRKSYLESLFIGGFILDLGIAGYGIYYGINTSSAPITLLGVLWLMASVFGIEKGEKEKHEYLGWFKYRLNKNGWLINSSSDCSNVSDYYFYENFREHNGVGCEANLKEEYNLFYDKLMKDSYIDPKKRLDLIKVIGEPIVLSNQESNFKQHCKTSLYIYFENGQSGLKHILK
ncbi:MAG: hypothetical protein IPL26_23980 [Leptospiraceae bacterium]|nr:hypothetical protein [Leptospiraceae bacterium]